MTVIIGAVFDEKNGALATDEQGSSDSRRYMNVPKLHAIEETALVAMTGNPDLLNLAVRQIPDGRGFLRKRSSVAQRLAHSLKEAVWDKIAANFEGVHGFSLDSLRTGQVCVDYSTFPVSLDTEVKGRALQHLDQLKQSWLSNAYVVIEKGPDGLQLYSLNAAQGSAMCVERPYLPMGSGSESADEEVYRFILEHLGDREKSVEPIEGIGALISAVDWSSRRNHGVGGVPRIAAILDGEIYQPSKITCRFASEVVTAHKAKLMADDAYKNLLRSTVCETTSLCELDAELKSVVEDRTKLEWVLRGYAQ